MKTRIQLNNDLVEEALRLTGLESVEEVVQRALEELVRRSKTRSLFDLAGRIRFADEYDPKELRELRRRLE